MNAAAIRRNSQTRTFRLKQAEYSIILIRERMEIWDVSMIKKAIWI